MIQLALFDLLPPAVIFNKAVSLHDIRLNQTFLVGFAASCWSSTLLFETLPLNIELCRLFNGFSL
jgi:hypothetical protein